MEHLDKSNISQQYLVSDVQSNQTIDATTDNDIDELETLFKEHNLNTDKNNAAIKIQRFMKKYFFNTLPSILIDIKNFLINNDIKLVNKDIDKRINSILDEHVIINILVKKFTENIIKKAPDRCWYDMIVFDNKCGWIPVNIKTSNMTSNDNVGNLTLCVQSYTDYELKYNKNYHNGELCDILIDCLKNKKLNKSKYKDYYFLVISKFNNKDIIINSVKGLTMIHKNANNLPFQIRWDKNRNFNYKPISENIKMYLNVSKKLKIWQVKYIEEIDKLIDYDL